MENEKEAPNFMCRSSGLNSFFVAEISLRILTFVSALVSICVMVTSHGQVTLFGIPFFARYNYFVAFRYFIVVEAVVCGFVLVSAAAACLYNTSTTQSSPWPSSSLKPSNIHYCMFLCDLIMMALILSGNSAASGVGYIGLKGQKQTSWMPVCNRVHQFCRQVTVSLAFAYIACASLFALIIMSSYRFKSLLSEST